MRVMALLLLLTSSAAAASGWQVSRGTDPMTDRTVAVATLPGTPSLRVSCTGSELVFARQIARTRAQIGVNFRFDDGAIVPRLADVNSDATTLYPWPMNAAATRSQIAGAKRLRVEVFVPGASRVFMDFDLTGGREAIASLGCR